MGCRPARLVGSLAVVAGALALQSCASTGATGTGKPVTPEPAAPVPEAALPPAHPFQPSAPGEIVSEATLSARRLVVGDMTRLGIVEAVEQGPRGVLRTALGPAFHAGNNRGYYYPKLASAYFDWAEPGKPLAVELWERGRKIGEYLDGAFLLGPEYAAPRQCTGPGAAGICGYAPGEAAPAVAATEARAGATGVTAAAPTRRGAGHRGFHAGAGVGGGSVGLSCDGCDFSRQTAVSGFLSLAAAVAENTLVGVEGTGWMDSESDLQTQVYSLMATATQYLNGRSGLFLRGGLGLVGYREESAFGDITANGVGFAARLGYELGVGPGFALVPYAAYVGTVGGTRFEFEGLYVGREFGINNLQFGLGFAIH